MDEYMDDHRCFECDSRWCWDYSCRVVGNVYVVGRGWTSKDAAMALQENLGYTVHWYEEVMA